MRTRLLGALVVVGMLGGLARAEDETVEVIDPGKGRKRAALYLALGGAALWTGSLTLNLVARSRYSKCADNGAVLDDLSACPYTEPRAAAEYANDQRKLARYYGTALFFAGAAAFGTALYLRITAPPTRKVVRVSTGPLVTPMASPDSLGFAVIGDF